ncbi:MAG TPA: ATP synthase F1 subunit gamma, partial [Planctomycetaceae bacterium]|nr:ATP synthase F1 subunit gamma [Planctomycetaceae bacterium]
ATDYTARIARLVADLAASGLEVSHPLLEGRAEVKNTVTLMLTANRGLCGGYNGNVIRNTLRHRQELTDQGTPPRLDVSGKRGINGMKFRKIAIGDSYTEFEDQPSLEAVSRIAEKYLEDYISGKLDRLDVVYTRFHSIAKQVAVVETLLPLGSLGGDAAASKGAAAKPSEGPSLYEFVPSPASILEEVVPMSFKVRLFKCFLDAAVSEQIARMVAMKSATENASEMIRNLSRTYNRARQSQITGEIMEVIGGVEALQS